MRRALPLVVLALLLAVGAFFALRPTPQASLRPDDASDGGPAGDSAAPDLVAAPRERPTIERTRIVDGEAPAEEIPPATDADVSIEGTVVDAESGKPIAGARVTGERAAIPCTRALLRPHPFLDGDSAAMTDQSGRVLTSRGGAIVTTNARGEFRLPWPDGGGADLFVKASGHVLTTSCRAVPGSPVTIRLARGLSIEGIVVTKDRIPIAGARVWTMPSVGRASELGHEETTQTGTDGRFTLTGLLPGSVVVRADAPSYMPVVSDAMEPGRRDVTLVLVPAFVVTFTITTDDGRQPDSPTVAWTTTGVPPRTGLEMLGEDGLRTGIHLENERKIWSPIRIPADRPAVRFDVKALGYSPWSSETVELPPEGGATELAVELRRDPNLGRLIVRLEDTGGQPLSYMTERVEPSIWRRDGQAIPAGIVLKPAETLEIPALPSGPYGLLLRSPGHAPVGFATVDVAAGRDTEVRAVLGPTAKVRVRFTATESTIVRFRLMKGREAAYPFVEGPAGAPGLAPESGSDRDVGDRVVGPEGATLSGLPTGRYTIEVISPELVATPTTVDLVEGDTKEVEISVGRR